ncbi:hypothetical protein [Polyangium jinanense]|uniref:Uncharacterized protein n=1 Tax=Polyangium jinanense TaxID=2829994 RepID=A0A9X4B0K4_9BACT|nr:hypothetical protein [Polyangium jinanense]MDC3962750.1 hypothetical protein [Polyangium jinanense]MDC3989257.1 hypothetical protein [Polyangium jinanense]
MSTDPDHNDDAPADDAVAQLLRSSLTPEEWERVRAAHERSGQIIRALMQWGWHESVRPLVAENVTDDELSQAHDLVSDIVNALRTGRRLDLARIPLALNVMRDVPNPREKEAVKLRFLSMFCECALTWLHFAKHDPERVHQFAPTSVLTDYDPAFAKLDNTLFDQCVKEITWGKRGPGANGWIRAAARVAASVGAFGYAEKYQDENERFEAFNNHFGKLWSKADRERFPDPDPRRFPKPKPSVRKK